MGRNAQDDQDQEKKDAHVVEEEQEEEKLLESESESEKSPQQKLGNSFLADMVNPLFGVGIDRGPRDRGAPTDEVIDVPGADASDDQQWDDTIFGSKDWMPPKRRVIAAAVIEDWLPPPLPDPYELMPPPGIREAASRSPQPYGVPGLVAVRYFHDTWLRVAREWLDAAGLDEFDAMADHGARVMAGYDASRARVLAMRFSAVSLGLTNLETADYGLRINVSAMAPHLDNQDRAMHAEGAPVPFSAKLAEATLNLQVPREELVFPDQSHAPTEPMQRAWRQMLGLRPGTSRLAQEDLAPNGTERPGTQLERDSLEDRATSLYADILRARVRLAAAAEGLFWAAQHTHGNATGPGLHATLMEADRHTEMLLNMLRQLGMGLYAATPWGLNRCRQQLVRSANSCNRIFDGIVVMMARWSALLLQGVPWPANPDDVHPVLPTEESIAALQALRIQQQSAPIAQPILEGPFGSWPWLRAATMLTAADQFAMQGELGTARGLHSQLIRELWTLGDPGAVSVALSWEPPAKG